MAYKLLCADIDGTLANSKKEVGERTRRAIRAAFDAGLYVTLATGRPYAGLAGFQDVLTGPVPLICANGAMLCDSLTGETLSETPLSAPAVEEIAERSLPSGALVVIWRGNGLWTGGPEELRLGYERSTRHASLPVSDFLAGHDHSAHKVLLRGPLNVIDACMADLTVRAVKGTDFFTSSADTLEIVARGVNKGRGLLLCADLLGLDPREAIAAGDGMNDVSMFRVAGLGAAMANASPAVRAAAAVTAPSNDEDGVAWLIEQYMLQG